MTPHPIKTPALIALLEPFVGAKLADNRDSRGYVIPRTIYVDIAEPGVRYRDADIRRADSDGVEIVNSSSGYVRELSWPEITEVVIRGEDGSGVAYRHVGEWSRVKRAELRIERHERRQAA